MYFRTRIHQKVTLFGSALGASDKLGTRLFSLLRNGSTAAKPFGGFLDCTNLTNLSFVKLLHIVSFNPTDDQFRHWRDLPPNHYVVGVHMHDRFYVATFNGDLKTFPLPQAVIDSFTKKYLTDNVVQISAFKEGMIRKK